MPLIISVALTRHFMPVPTISVADVTLCSDLCSALHVPHMRMDVLWPLSPQQSVEADGFFFF